MLDDWELRAHHLMHVVVLTQLGFTDVTVCQVSIGSPTQQMRTAEAGPSSLMAQALDLALHQQEQLNREYSDVIMAMDARMATLESQNAELKRENAELKRSLTGNH